MGNRNATSNVIPQMTQVDFVKLEAKTGMPLEEIHEWYEKFQKDYPNGSFTLDELKSLLKKSYPRGNPDKYSLVIFKAFDKDQNKRITFDEFFIVMSIIKNSNRNPLKCLDFFFDIYDINGDEKISRQELTKMLEAIYELMDKDLRKIDEKVNSIFKLYDADQNGWLSKSEFIKFISQDQNSFKLIP